MLHMKQRYIKMFIVTKKLSKNETEAWVGLALTSQKLLGKVETELKKRSDSFFMV